jgi:flagellar motor switch protein FliN/FliY
MSEIPNDPQGAQSAGSEVSGQGASAAPPETAAAFAMPELGSREGSEVVQGMDLLSDVTLNVKIELGRTRMLVEDVLKLGEGAVVELEKLAGDPVDVFVNERHVARGEILVVNDNFCVRISEIIQPESLERAKRTA